MLNVSIPLRALFGIAALAGITLLGLVLMTNAQADTPQSETSSPLLLTEAELQEAESLYNRKCGGCHSLDQDRVGPRHRKVFGAKAGSVEGFRYSRALQDLDIVWTTENLDEWLANPPAFARGTFMGFSLRKADERKAIIAYLEHASLEQNAD